VLALVMWASKLEVMAPNCIVIGLSHSQKLLGSSSNGVLYTAWLKRWVTLCTTHTLIRRRVVWRLSRSHANFTASNFTASEERGRDAELKKITIRTST
jgi:hypothetical protein